MSSTRKTLGLRNSSIKLLIEGAEAAQREAVEAVQYEAVEPVEAARYDEVAAAEAVAAEAGA
jgi:hypothetical protein